MSAPRAFAQDALTAEEWAAVFELRRGDGTYYVAQERAFASGIAGEWPTVIKHPKSPHGRLVRRTWPVNDSDERPVAWGGAPRMSPTGTGSALIDRTGRYRYRLRRQWTWGSRAVLWVMLNPSTADATLDDPTIRRCIGLSHGWDYDGLVVVNLFALRATDPKALRALPEPYQGEHEAIIGPSNDEHILWSAAHANLIVAAWGNHGTLYNRGDEVRELLADWPLHHLGLTKMGQPRHPLYVRGDAKPQAWEVSG